jgi:RNA polymerase sigma-70 factor (ECF subfamily)
MKDLEDQILVRRALKADPDSFGELCRRYYCSLVAVAYSVLMDHHLAEDAAQEALAAACRQLPRLKKQGRFGPWVVAICRNVARDMLWELKRQRKPIVARQERQNNRQDDDQKVILAEALQHLPQNLKEVIFLRFYNEMSYRQMAKVLGTSEQVIDGRIRRAKKKMTVYLKKVGFRR